MTPEGLEAIKRHEGLRLKAYRCPAGVWTIGYGHTKNVKDTDSISLIQAEKYLIDDLLIAEKDIRSLVYNYELISPKRQDALVNLCFNLGKTRLSKFGNFLSYVRRSEWASAASALQHSLWFKQVGNRGKDIVKMIIEG